MARPHHRALLPQVLDDIRALARLEDQLVDAALQAIVDPAEHRQTGKLLGPRHVSGDLSGCRRLRFDLADQYPHRFRIIYRLLPNEDDADTVEVIAVGPRGGHAPYQAAVARLTST